MKIGVIVAMEKEAQAIVSALGRSKFSHKASLIISGVGKVNAAIATTEAINAGCTHIINFGLAGGLDPDMKVGDCFQIKRAVQYDFDLSNVNGTGVGVLDESVSPYFLLTGLYASTRGATIGTADRFGDGDYQILKDLSCDLRDMECAAIAQVCDKRNVGFASYKVVSDVVGCGATGDQYKKNLDTSLKKLGGFAKEVLDLMQR